jgi:hypothetical protein
MIDYLLGMMVLTGPLFALLLFGLVAAIAVLIAWWAGRKEQRKWGRWMAFWFLLFAFWDTPLVLGHFGYACWADGGFHEYKSAEQWKQENPGVAETLEHVSAREWMVKKKPPMNQRFEFHESETAYFTGLIRSEMQVIDIGRNEVVARYTDFRTFREQKIPDLASPRTYKFWLNHKTCEDQGWPERVQFNDYLSEMKNLGRE